MGRFLELVGEAKRGVANLTGGKIRCGSDGVCLGFFGQDAFEVEHPKANPSALRFQMSVSGKLRCSDFAKHRVVRTWPYACTVKRHCKMTEGPLEGMHLWLSYMAPHCSSTGTTVFVFTEAYLRARPDIDKTLHTEGLGRPEPTW